MSTMKDRTQSVAGLWRHSGFLRLWAADSFYQVDRQMSVVVVPLIGAITLDANAFQMGFLLAATTAPALVIGLIAGVWIDRLPRRTVMIVAASGRGLVVSAVPVLWFTGTLTIEILALCAFLGGALAIFFEIGRQAWLPGLIGRDRLVEANGKIGATRSIAQMLGPSIGGGLAGIVAAPYALLVAGITNVTAAGLVSRAGGDDRAPASSGPRQPAWRQALDGLALAYRNRILRATIGAGSVVALFGHVFIAVYVLYMANYLHLSAFAIGLVFGVGGFGALLGSLLAAPVARRFGIGRTVIAGWLLFGLGGLPIPLAILVPEYALPLVLFSELFQWMVLEIADINQLSLRQAITPDEYLGRISATDRFVVAGMIPIGSLIGGALGSLVGVPATLLIGVGGMMLAFLWVLLSPLRSLHTQPSEPMQLVPSPSGD
jgi:MFS family permease